MNIKELDGKNKMALRKMNELAIAIHVISDRIAVLGVEKDSMCSDFAALLRCFPDARHVYYKG